VQLKPLLVPAFFVVVTGCASASAVDRTSTVSESPNTSASGAAAAAADSVRAALLEQATAPAGPVQIRFDWSLQDRDFKFQGRGLVRMQGPYRARLDLFGPQDIQVLRAVLNGDSLELAYAGPSVPLPPPAFLWALLGVFRSPAARAPDDHKTAEGLTTLQYDVDRSHWRFTVADSVLTSVEWVGDDGGRRTVELSGPYQGARPSRAAFRDWRAFRELVLTATAVEAVEPFAPGIWDVSNR
jgi:hypothetical protein